MSSALFVDVANMYAANAAKLGHLRRSSDGRSTGGVFGLCRMVEACVERLKPDEVFYVFEGGGADIRREVDASYKADRVDNGLFQPGDFDIIERIAVARGFCVIRPHGGECDDAIAKMVKEATFEQQTILSRDHDFKQLLPISGVDLLSAAGDPVYTAVNFEKENGFPADWYTAYLCLVGDPSDNVDGPCTPREAKELLAKRDGYLPAVLEMCLDDELLEPDEVEMVRRNEKLIGFLDCSYDGKQNVLGPDYKALHDVYTEMEFNSLLKKLDTQVL